MLHGLQDGASYWVLPFIVVVLVLGSWFIVNLSLVVIVTQFKITRKYEHKSTSIALDAMFCFVSWLMVNACTDLIG